MVQPGQSPPEGFTLIGTQLAVSAEWLEGFRRKTRKSSGQEKMKLMIDGLLRPQQIAMYGGMSIFTGTYLYPVLKSLEGNKSERKEDLLVFNRGPFWRRVIVIACACVSVHLSANHKFVQTITQQFWLRFAQFSAAWFPQTLKSAWIWILSWKVLDFSICLENGKFSLKSTWIWLYGLEK